MEKSEKKGRKSKLFLEEVDKEILDLLLKGTPILKVIDKLMTEWEFATDSNCRKRIDKVISRMALENKQEIENKITIYKNRLEDLYERASEAQDFKNANAIIQNLIKLEGLEVTKIEAKVESTNDINLTNITDEKLEQLVDKIIKNNVGSNE